jgi:hypothetical protein
MVSLGVLSGIEKDLRSDIWEKAIDMVLPESRKKLAKSNMEAVMLGTGANVTTDGAVITV